MEEKVDPEMIENLDMLMVFDVIEEEENWENIEQLDEADKALQILGNEYAGEYGIHLSLAPNG